MSNTLNQKENHREGFRINDRVALLVRRLDDAEVRQANILFESRRRDLAQAPDSDPIADFKKLSLAQVRKCCPEAHAYIAYLEEKIEKLQRLAGACKSALPAFPSDLVNFSISGIRFQSSAALHQSSVIEIVLRLFPSQVSLLFFARVTRCEAAVDGQTPSWNIGAVFTHIDEKDRELLARHIHKFQMDALNLLVD